jgi:hypothetical protein
MCFQLSFVLFQTQALNTVGTQTDRYSDLDEEWLRKVLGAGQTHQGK